MEDVFRKFLYTGVGMVAYTVERIQETTDRLVKEGKISADEGRRMMDDFIGSTEAKKNEFETQMRNVTERVVKNFNFASGSELEDLKARVASLEAQLSEQKGAAKKGATTKA